MAKKRKKEISFYNANKESLKFILIFTATATLFYLIYYYLLIDSIVLSMLKNGTAQIVASLLALFGFKASSNGNFVILNGFSMEIIDECTAIFSVIIYVSAVIAYPATVKQKLIGIVFGIVLLYSIDVLRLIILSIIGIFNPEIFEYVHVYLWQATFIAFVIIVYVLWISKVKEYVR